MVFVPTDRSALAAQAADALGRIAPDVPPGRLLAALAALAPAELLRLAVEEPAATPRSSRRISAAIAQALRTSEGELHERRALAARILDAYADVLTAPAALAPIEAAGTIAPPQHGALARIRTRFRNDPSVLRAAATVEAASGDAHGLDATLTASGSVDPSPGTMAFISRRRPDAADVNATTVRVALLSSYTIDSLVPYLDHASRAVGLAPQIHVAAFNSWTREVIDEASPLRRFDPEIAFLAVAIDDLVPELSGPIVAEDLARAGDSALERVVTVARSFAGWAGGVPLVVHSFHSAYADTLGVLDSRDAASPRLWLARLNVRLAEALRDVPSAYVLDVPAAVAEAGGALRDNPKIRHLAAMRLPPEALAGIAQTYVRYIAPLKGLTRKCVVVDLDNTLWGGVVGEDLKDGLRLGHTSPGSEYVEFQEYLRLLPARGILLALNRRTTPTTRST